jgi:hypothetical protein
MIIASVKVFLLFLIVDIISNCQTIIIDNYTYLGLILNEFLGSRSNRPQTKSPPSRTNPKSNRPQVKSAPDQILKKE